MTALESRLLAAAAVRGAWRDRADVQIDVQEHFGELCADLCASQLAPRGIRCEFRADSAPMPAALCGKLSLALAELVSRAAEHAFRGRSSGRVSVSLRRTPVQWICVVIDNGCDFAGDRGYRRLVLIEFLTAAMNGTLRVHSDPGGTVACIVVPAADNAPGDPLRGAVG